jgi:hypothetical protein
VVNEARDLLLRRLAHARRVMILHGEGWHPWPAPRTRGAEVLGELARHFQEILFVDDAEGQAAWMGRRGLRQGDAASLVGDFLRGGLDLGLVVEAPCQSAEGASALALAWRAGAWIQRVGDPPCELEALVKASLPGDAQRQLGELWECFTGGPAPEGL